MNLKRVIASPSTFFKDPFDLLAFDKITKEEKMRALKNWEKTCRQLQTSDNEGMLGPSNNVDLGKVQKAMEVLGEPISLFKGL